MPSSFDTAARSRVHPTLNSPMRPPRRFPPPRTIEESSACFIVRDHDKQALAYVYYENEAGRRSSAKLPSAPRQILKDNPRPPNSASRED